MKTVIKLIEERLKDVERYKIACLRKNNQPDYKILLKQSKELMIALDLAYGFKYLVDGKVEYKVVNSLKYSRKLSKTNVMMIKQLLEANNLTQSYIADMFGVSKSTITLIKQDKILKHCD